MPRSLAVLGIALALSSCVAFGGSGGGAGETPAPSPTDDQGGGAQVLEEVLGGWASDEAGAPRLEFGESGIVRGTDGCNGITTRYSAEGDRIVLESFASTLKSCVGVDDWLRGARELHVAGDELVVFNSSGDEIGRLQREA